MIILKCNYCEPLIIFGFLEKNVLIDRMSNVYQTLSSFASGDEIGNSLTCDLMALYILL